VIALAENFLVFQLASGENIPFSSEMVSIELMGDAASDFDPEIFQHAAASVFHYFKHDLDRQTVTIGEFAEVLEKVLRGLGFQVHSADATAASNSNTRVAADLKLLARESGEGCELVFYPRLRDALREQLRQSPDVIRFHGLRGCVKHLAGARRWSPRCESLQEQIIAYLRQCLTVEVRDDCCALLVK
jgi:hypothetical protein